MSSFSISQKQLNDIAKGKPIQISYSGLSSNAPNVSIQGLGMPSVNRIKRALREQRGARLKLTPDEITSIKTTLKGGNFLDDLKNAFDPQKNGVAQAFAPDGAAEKFGKSLARPAIKGAANLGVGGLMTLAGSPEFAPFVSPFVSMAIDKGLDKANLGFGLKEGADWHRVRMRNMRNTLKGSKEAKDKMARIRSMRKGSKGGNILDQQFSINEAKDTIKKLFGGELGGVDEGAGIAEDVVRAFTVKKTGKGMKGCGTPILDQQFSINEAKDALGKIFGFGVSPAMVKELKGHMADLFSGQLDRRKAVSLANKVFKHGTDLLHLPSVKMAGGALSLNWLTDKLKSGAKQIFELAKPAIKIAGQTGISYVKPLATEALKGIASSYGIDPEMASLAANIAAETGSQIANVGLDKVTKKAPKAPQKPSMAKTFDSREDAQHSSRSSDDINEEILVLPSRKSKRDLKGGSFYGGANPALYPFRESANLPQGLISMYGGAMREDFGNLLNMDHPSMTPFIQAPNLPQGLISVYGGSFRGYGTPILDQKFSVNEAKNFLTKDVKKLFGGSFQ
jgi:hypothetical protein